MHEYSLKFLSCVRCKNKLQLDVIKKTNEIDEGFLHCTFCKKNYPIIFKIPILIDNLEFYFSNRRILGGKLYAKTKNSQMKKFLKTLLLKKHCKTDERSKLEQRWTKIYQNSTKSRFYSVIRNNLNDIKKAKLVLEHGCSIGKISHFLARKHEMVFGIDRSFYAIIEAKKTLKENLDFFVADSINHPFARQKFELIVGLNLLELIEPIEFLKTISNQVKFGNVLLSDPYDYDRGSNSVKTQLDAISIRKYLKKLDFSISTHTKNPSFIPWSLNLTPRTQLKYKSDIILAKK